MNFKFKAALVAALSLAPFTASAFDGPELYDGEQALYEKAQEEGLIVSFDTGPTWANWSSQFKNFKARYPGLKWSITI